MKSLSQKTQNFQDSIIRHMTTISNSFNAINLSQGFPEFKPPKEILDRLSQVAYEDFNQYPISYGAKNTREALAEKINMFSGVNVNPETELTITCGGTEAMTATLFSIINEGDKVAMFTPIYENYKTTCILTGAVPVYIPLNPPKYTFDANYLEDVFKQGLKAIIVCNPSNPCGKVFTFEEMTIIANLAKKYDVYVITDEVYEHMVYKPNKMIYMATLPDMRERTIVCNSMSKTYSITGWRIGYTMAPKPITDVIKKVHNFLTISASAPLQEAIVVGLKFGKDYYDELLKLYTKKKDIICNGLKTIGIDFHEPEGTYFVLMDLGKYVKKSGLNDDFEFAKMVCEKYKIAFVPSSNFFMDNGKTNGIFRLHFAKNDDTLQEAINRIERITKI